MSREGFSLVEVLLALGLLCIAVLGSVQLVAAGIQAVHAARVQGHAVTLASSRLEELRGLVFEFDDLGAAVTDVSSDLSTTPRSGGGTGLLPGGSVTTSVAGFVDHLDEQGRWLGNGAAAPVAAAFTRRWSLAPSVLAPDTIVVQVAVLPRAAALTGGSGQGVPGAATVGTLLSRRQR